MTRIDKRRLMMDRPPVPEEKPDDWEPPNVREEQCAVCGDTFQRHEDDPPTCSQDCWKRLRERPQEDSR